MRILDEYFNRPIFWDYLVASVVTFSILMLFYSSFICTPKEEYIHAMSSDLANVGLTSAGFILTLLTVLITFKSGSSVSKQNLQESSTFELFFETGLYKETVKHLKNCIKSLIFVSLIGYCMKLGLPKKEYSLLYFYNIFGLAIIVLTLFRCLLILTKILRLQNID